MRPKHHILKKIALAAALLSSLLITSWKAQAETGQYIGFGAEYDSAIYQGQDGFTTPYPLFDLSYGPFFLKNKTLGWTAYTRENISVALIATQGSVFLNVADINQASRTIFAGIQDRDQAYEAGFLYTYYSPVGVITWKYMKDVSDTYGGMRNILRLSRPTGNPNLISFTPSIYVQYFSSAFNDYYYGIDAKDNERGLAIVQDDRPDLTLEEFEQNFRPQFEGKNSGHIGIDLWIRKPYTQNLIGVAYLGAEEVLGEVYNSTLVEDKKRFTFRLGLQYKF